MKKSILIVFALFLLLSRGFSQSIYFPPITGNVWDTLSGSSLGWCMDQAEELYDYIDSTNGKAFIVLKDGKIVIEKYFNGHKADSFWYWASAGKTMTAFLVGIAKENHGLNLSDTSSIYLGKGWSSLTAEQESQITVWHHLTMTTGLDDTPPINKDCTEDSCLKYLADPGTRWAYHNAAYTLLDKVVEAASGKKFQQFFNEQVSLKTGIFGLWVTQNGYNNVLLSQPRSMARFGSLLLNKGYWGQTKVLGDTQYFIEMIQTSQSLNPSYGYLTWLNGKDKFMVPGLQIQFPGMLAPQAPKDMYSAMGKNGQLLMVVPSQNLVVVRMGDAPGDNGDVPITFSNDIWKRLNKVICNQPQAEKEIEAESLNINCYPNPFTDKLWVNALEGNSVTVFNQYGQILFTGSTGEIDTHEWAAGIYFIEVSGKNGKIVRRVFKSN